MNNRLKQVRAALKIDQPQFGEKLGLAATTISSIERGQNPLKEYHIKLLESIYNVNPNWLRTGEGDMFKPTDTSSLAALQNEYHLSDRSMKILSRFIRLPNDEQEDLIHYLEKLIKEDD